MITSRAYHALFMHNMLIRPTAAELEAFGEPDFVIYNAGGCTQAAAVASREGDPRSAALLLVLTQQAVTRVANAVHHTSLRKGA